MKKNYDYEEIERWARAGFQGAERHAKYSPKRNTEENEVTTERQGGFFRSFGFQFTAALLVMLIVSGGIFAALKHMERIAEMNSPAQSDTAGITEPVQTVSTDDPYETSEDITDETEPETQTIEPPYIENGKYPAYLSVTSGAEMIYPDDYMLYTEEYDDDNDVWLSADGIGAAGAESVPLIRYDGTKNISIDYYEGIDVRRIRSSCSKDGKEYSVEFDYMNDFFTKAEDGVYRFVIEFVINGRQIGSQYECSCFEYPFDVEVKRETAPAIDWDGLTKTERIERALDEITAYGINYQRWRYLCGAEHADDIYDHGGYYIDDPAEAEYTYDYLLGKFDAETDPKRKSLMYAFISSFLGSTWDSELRFPYYTKYLPDITWFETDNITYDETRAASCDKWIREDYYNAFCEYAAYMTEAEVKANYPASYKLIKKYGFNGFSDSAKTPEQKANRTVKEFFNMALSVKYGVAVSDPSSDAYVRYNEIFDEKPYGPGDNVYKALLKFYDKDQLDNENSAPVAFEQRGGIKYINDWRSYFTSLTSKEIADGFIKESKCFLTTSDGLVLTVDNYYFFNSNNLNSPSAGELYFFEVNGDKATARLYVYDVDWQENYSIEFSVENGEYKITGGTFITEWLARTLSVEVCKMRDTLMDAEKLVRLIGSGAVSDFSYYDFDVSYNIKYGETAGLPEGLEAKLNEIALREGDNGRKYYICDRVLCASLALSTYDSWIRYFSQILPEDVVRDYIKETQYFLIIDGNVYLLDNKAHNCLKLDYRTMRVTEGSDGTATVTVTALNECSGHVGRDGFDVTFELQKTEERYRIVGGTFIELVMKCGDPASLLQGVFEALWSRPGNEKMYSTGDNASSDVPQELIDIANKCFGERGKYQIYFSFEGINDVSYFKEKAAEFFTEDTLRIMFDNNERAFVKIGDTLYVNGDLEDICFLDVTGVSRFEKLSDGSYEIDLTVMNNGMQNPYDMSFTAKISIVSGRPVITGGNFLDFVFDEMLVLK